MFVIYCPGSSPSLRTVAEESPWSLTLAMEVSASGRSSSTCWYALFPQIVVISSTAFGEAPLGSGLTSTRLFSGQDPKTLSSMRCTSRALWTVVRKQQDQLPLPCVAFRVYPFDQAHRLAAQADAGRGERHDDLGTSSSPPHPPCLPPPPDFSMLEEAPAGPIYE